MHQVMSLLTKYDLRTNNVCHGLSLTDLMKFENEALIKKWESEFCILDPEKMWDRLMKTPKMKRMVEKVSIIIISSPRPISFMKLIINLKMRKMDIFHFGTKLFLCNLQARTSRGARFK